MSRIEEGPMGLDESDRARIKVLEERMQVVTNTAAEAHAISTKAMEVANEAKRDASDTSSAFVQVVDGMKRQATGTDFEIKRLENLLVSTREEVKKVPASVKHEMAPTPKEERNTKLRRWGLTIGIILYGVFQAFQLMKGGH